MFRFILSVPGVWFRTPPEAVVVKGPHRAKTRRSPSGGAKALLRVCRRACHRRRIKPAKLLLNRTTSGGMADCVDHLTSWMRRPPAVCVAPTAGCALIGVSDAGKTRIGYDLLRKAALVGIYGMAVTHAELRRAASNLNASDPKRSDPAHTLLNACRRAACLLIDDIGKGSSTPVADETFFDLLTHRRDYRMLTHWTANAGSEWLAKRFGEDKRRPIIIRLARLTDGHIYVAD